MRHAGGVRIDHVLGFIRQYWVPHGRSGREGAYVRCPSQEWLGIVALESVRSGCVVLGEDLGTVPDGLREELARRRILRSHVAWFERDHDGRFVSPERFAELSITSALTHDLPAFLELWEGRDLAQRCELGLLPGDVLEREQGERARSIEALVASLHEADALDRSVGRSTERAPELVLRALYDWLSRAPGVLALALDDLALEPNGVNIPGTGPEVPNWTRRMTRSLVDLRQDESLLGWVRELSTRRRAVAATASAQSSRTRASFNPRSACAAERAQAAPSRRAPSRPRVHAS
jgi:4-alpha-glucanotransferase